MTKFEATWRPRIGIAACSELHKSGVLMLGLWLAAIGSWTGAILVFNGALVAGNLACGASIFFLVTFSVFWRRSRRRVVSLIGSHLGLELNLRDLPKLRAATFDAWCEQKGLGHQVEAGVVVDPSVATSPQ